MLNKKIYIIAGEASGDILGSSLISALKENSNDDLTFLGVGGKNMMEEGLTSLFPMEDLSVMGVAEILPKLFDLLKRIRQTIENIEKQKPDIIITIDSPDFCFRVVKAIKKRGKIKVPCVHYVAPSVWAWRPKRAKKVAQFLDHILTLLPFEPSYFEKEGLASTFVGHPMIEDPNVINADGQRFREKYNIDKNQKIFCVLAGSRHSELKRMLPVFKNVVEEINASHENIKIISIALPHLKQKIEDVLGSETLILTTDKYDAFAASNVALATSGTVALELAMTGAPSVIGYRMGAISSFIAKLLVKTPYVSLPNIILNKPIIPELLLDNCTVENLSKEVDSLLTDINTKELQKQAFADMRKQLSGMSPSKRAAKIILNLIQTNKLS